MPTSGHTEAGGERVLQRGEGRVVRGFVDWILEQLTRRDRYRGRVVVVPRPHDEDALTPGIASHGQFRVAIRGIDAGRLVDEVDPVSVVSRVRDPYCPWEAF
jgi:mannitol-1-phosphate/altronate dehydrogenase